MFQFIDNNSMVNKIADYEVMGDKTLHNKKNNFYISFNDLEKHNSKIDSSYTSNKDSYNFLYPSPIYTSTPFLDHSYTKLIPN